MAYKNEISAYNAQYGGLRGAKILEFYMEQCEYNSEEFWPTFRMQKVMTYSSLYSQDPEGNGSGFAFIEDV